MLSAEKAFKGSDSAILVDYKGMNVPQVTELRRQLRTAKASYKVVKNTIARRALKGTSLDLSQQQITLGRANDATLVLNDDYASSRHARIFPQDGQWIVEDLGSTNGTYLDRQKVTRPMPVPVGVPIRIGKTVLELRR